LETWRNSNATQDEIKFGAKFTNWHTLIAHGNSKIEVIENLRSNLKNYSKENKLPRPGTEVSFRFADSKTNTSLTTLISNLSKLKKSFDFSFTFFKFGFYPEH